MIARPVAVALLGLIGIAGAAHAQQAAVPPDAFDFKGLRFGVPISGIMERFPQADCRVTAIVGCVLTGSTYAAEPAETIVLDLVGGTFQRVLVTFKPDSYDRIVEALAGKYGPPTAREAYEMTTLGGMKGDQRIATWRIEGKGRITVRRYNGDLTRGLVKVVSSAAIADESTRELERAKRAAQDI